jgi:glutamine amidotransferase-like uncharacterized protein/uncharacterized lipoprotein YddW (UPF0748 family)
MQRYFLTIVVSILLLGSGPAYSQEDRGVYIWPASFYEMGGIENVMEILRQNKITDVFLLVKGEAGYSLFPSDYTYKEYYTELYKNAANSDEKEKISKRSAFMTDPLLLDKIIEQSHKNNIRIHAWFIISGDRRYVENHPGSEVTRIPKPDTCKYPYPVIDKGHVNLAYPPYKEYIFAQINKALEYPFDGLMLDKIRYTSLAYTWDQIHLSKALRAGVNIDKVIDCAVKTLYGKDDDKEEFFYKYRDGDKDLREWIKIKKADIEDYVKEARGITKEKNILLSASFMPEGAYDEDFADVHYAQNFSELSPYLDYIVIMSYAKSFSKPASWVKAVAANAIDRSSCKIWTAIQGYDSVSSEMVYEQTVNAMIANSDGVAVFRLGEMNPSMWSEFRKGMDINVDAMKNAQIKGIVYSGCGTIRNCWLKTADAFYQSDDVLPFMMKENELKKYDIYNGMKFILIPGGGGSAEAEALDTTGLKNIEKFVSNGGGYIGICAGAYLPVKGYNGNLTEKLQIVNASPLDVDHWNRGSGPVKLEIKKKHPIFAGLQEKEFELNYFSGPVLEPSNLDMPAYKELAVFKTDYHENGAAPGAMLNKTAILEAKYHKGRIILFSPHPELTPGKEKMLINAAEYVSQEK